MQKRSKRVCLLFLGGVAALSGCSSNDGDSWDSSELNNVSVPVHQKYYSNLEDCKKDWGRGNAKIDNPKDGDSGNWDNLCELVKDDKQIASNSGGSGGGGYYMGPRYYHAPNGGVEILGLNNTSTNSPLKFNNPSAASFYSKTNTISANHLSPKSSVVSSVKSASIARSAAARGGFGGGGRAGFSGGG